MLSPWLVRGEFPLQCDARGFKEMNRNWRRIWHLISPFIKRLLFFLVYIFAVSLILKKYIYNKNQQTIAEHSFILF